MMKRILFFISLITLLAVGTSLYAVDINLINVDMGPDENQRLANAYGQAYGYQPQQVQPALSGPPQEVPAILQIAQAAGTVPMTVWMMRRMGMGYGSILSTFALAPSVLAGGPAQSPYNYGPYQPSPTWSRWSNPFYVQLARVNFLRNVLRVPTRLLPHIPIGGDLFHRSILYPYHPVHGTWMPPGIAKKYGLWIPPGQRKKIGWGPWSGPGWKPGKHAWKNGGPDWKGKGGKNNGPGGGKPSWKSNGNGGKGKSGKGDNWQKGKPSFDKKGKGGGSSNQLAKGNGPSKGSSKGSFKGRGGSKAKGGPSHKGKGGGKGRR